MWGLHSVLDEGDVWNSHWNEGDILQMWAFWHGDIIITSSWCWFLQGIWNPEARLPQESPFRQPWATMASNQLAASWSLWHMTSSSCHCEVIFVTSMSQLHHKPLFFASFGTWTVKLLTFPTDICPSNESDISTPSQNEDNIWKINDIFCANHGAKMLWNWALLQKHHTTQQKALVRTHLLMHDFPAGSDATSCQHKRAWLNPHHLSQFLCSTS